MDTESRSGGRQHVRVLMRINESRPSTLLSRNQLRLRDRLAAAVDCPSMLGCRNVVASIACVIALGHRHSAATAASKVSGEVSRKEHHLIAKAAYHRNESAAVLRQFMEEVPIIRTV